MASVLAVCSGLGRTKLTHFLKTTVRLTHPGTHTVFWKNYSQYQQITSNEDMVINPTETNGNYKPPEQGTEFHSFESLHTTTVVQGLQSHFKTHSNGNLYKEPLKKCILCGKRVDYKNVQLLSQFISPFTGCIYGRHITGLCGKKQKEITKAIKRAQIMGFMPVTYKDPAYLKDPKVCNIKYRE